MTVTITFPSLTVTLDGILPDSEEWKVEYNTRTLVEHSNKREETDFLLEDGRHRSTKMWYCRLYHILMLQHLDACDLS